MAERTFARSSFAWAGRVLAWLVILGTGAVVVVAVLVPRIAGATPYVILTGSMRPHMPPGTLVVSKPLSPSRIAIGDVITYQVRSGKPAVVTHRVVAVGVGVHGPVFRTQGDANNTPDKDWVRPVQVRGERWYYVPYLGYVTSLITSGQRQVITVLIESVLVVYAAVEFGTALLDRLRRRRKVAL